MSELWVQPFAKSLPPSADAPVLVLNSARLEDGRRVLQSNVQFALPDAEDLLGAGFEPRASALTLVGAAHNSARFPIVSPPGSVYTRDGRPWGHLGDGGYYEVTGAATLSDVVEQLIAAGCLRQEWSSGPELRAVRLWAKGRCGSDHSSQPDARVVVVFLDNQPRDYSETLWLRTMEGTPHDWPPEQRTEMLRRSSPQPIEVAGPLVGLLSHSSQEAQSASRRLASLAGTDSFSVVELRLPRYRGLREPSMNWQLDHDSRREMMCAAESSDPPSRPVLSVGSDNLSCIGDKDGFLPRRPGKAANLADEALQRNLQRLRGWIHHQNGKPTMVVSALTSASPEGKR